MQEKRRKKKDAPRVGIPPRIWLPEAYHFGNLLTSNGIRHAIFGAGTLAVHNVMVRPTIDIDFVVDDYKKAIDLLKSQPDIVSSNLQEEKDGIQVADFYFKSGVSVQIWDNNLYSLPMTDDSWSRVVLRPVPGYGPIQSISLEDLIISKVGRYSQQGMNSEYEADKNLIDIVTTVQTLSRPDFRYAIQRLRDGARRETLSNSSRIHPLDWYFIKEVQAYRNTAKRLDYDKIAQFIAAVLVGAKTASIEYGLLRSLRNSGSLSEFQSSFMLDDESLGLLLRRWGPTLKVSGDKAGVSSKDIQAYLKRLRAERPSEYAKRIAHPGRNSWPRLR